MTKIENNNSKKNPKKSNHLFQVIHHDSMKLGRSKEEFLQINGPQIATATHVVVLMTDAMTTSPFIFHEVLFADWLGKKLVTAMFKNVWTGMRFSLKAVLGRWSLGKSVIYGGGRTFGRGWRLMGLSFEKGWSTEFWTGMVFDGRNFRQGRC